MTILAIVVLSGVLFGFVCHRCRLAVRRIDRILAEELTGHVSASQHTGHATDELYDTRSPLWTMQGAEHPWRGSQARSTLQRGRSYR